NLPALVLKIMSGTFAPISDRYSPELRQLILSLLNLEPCKRPQLDEIMAEGLCARPLLNLYTDPPPFGMAGGPSLPGATEQLQPQFVCRFLEGQSGVTIKHVACGDLFTACLTDRGIVLTFGSGSSGCLGHGAFVDVSQPKIVEALLGYEITQAACGASHALALSSEGEVFAWGRGDNGRLGLGNQESHNSPQLVALPSGYEAQKCYTIGSNQHGQLGPVSCRASRAPYLVEGLQATRVTLVGCGDAFTLAVGADGEVYTWGKSARGRLGRKEEEPRSPRPVQLEEAPPSLVVSVSCCHGTTLLTAKPAVEEPSPQ
ncbi:hypothetical protein E2320_017982, partial [Naja naja]